jgi:choline dehydrogenase-like flavoprotein
VHEPTEAEINDNNRILADGCARLGYRTRKFELNMRDCLGCGYCGEGCAYDRKQGTLVTYIADALASGVRLVHHCEVEALQFERRGGSLTAVGARGRVRATKPGSRPSTVAAGPVEFRAKLVLVCCGAIETPALLQRSGYPDPEAVVGRGLVLHPAVPIAGLMDRQLTNYRGISGTIYSDHFFESHGLYFECLFGHPVYGAVVLPSIGPEHFELMRQIRRLAGFGVLLVDGVDPANSVRWDPTANFARIRYRLGETDRERLRFGISKAVEVMFAAGAREVIVASEEPVGPLPTPRFRNASEAKYCADLQFTSQRTTVTSSHCQSTVKMGEDASRCAVNSRGETRHARGLVLCDSSVFPTSCGVNPMLSVMTMARYQGLRIAAEFARYEG